MMKIFLVIHIIARNCADRFKSTFQTGLFQASFFALVVGLFFMNQDPPPEDAMFIGIIDAIAQSEIMGISLPVAFIYISFFLVVLSWLVKFLLNRRKPAKRRISDKASMILLNVLVGFTTIGFAGMSIYLATADPNSIITLNYWVSAFASCAIISGMYWHAINRKW